MSETNPRPEADTPEMTLSQFCDLFRQADITCVELAVNDGCGDDYLAEKILHFLVAGEDDGLIRDGLLEAGYQLRWDGQTWEATIAYDVTAHGDVIQLYDSTEGLTLKPLQNQLAYREYAG